jgi:hypothetical protein
MVECGKASKELSAKKKGNVEDAQPCDKACKTSDIGCCILSGWPVN